MVQNFQLAFLLLYIAFIITSAISAPLKNVTESNKNASRLETGRGLYGLLGFLTGFRLGQGVGHTSYSADIRESAQLNLFAKLFNGVLYFTYSKYPYPYFDTNPNPSAMNVYPSNLQLPIFYPPIILPQGNNPINQQQIVNVHEPFNPNEAPNENYQELNEHNTQHIENNFSGPEPNDDDVNFSIKTSATNVTDGKNNDLCVNTTCISPIESEFDFNADSSNVETSTVLLESTTIIKENHNTTENMSNHVAITENPEMKAHDSTPQTSTPINVSNFTYNDSSSYHYPNSYYSYYDNASQYEHISITEYPIMKNYEDYLPKLDIEIPFSQNDIERNYNTFYPISGTYSNYVPNYYSNNRFSKNIEDSDFKPMDGSNNI